MEANEREIQKPFDRRYLKKEQTMDSITVIHPLFPSSSHSTCEPL